MVELSRLAAVHCQSARCRCHPVATAAHDAVSPYCLLHVCVKVESTTVDLLTCPSHSVAVVWHKLCQAIRNWVPTTFHCVFDGKSGSKMFFLRDAFLKVTAATEMSNEQVC